MRVLLAGVLAVMAAGAAALPTLQAEHRLPPDLVLPDTASIPGQRLADWGVDKFFSLWYIFALSDNVEVSSEYPARARRQGRCLMSYKRDRPGNVSYRCFCFGSKSDLVFVIITLTLTNAFYSSWCILLYRIAKWNKRTIYSSYFTS